MKTIKFTNKKIIMLLLIISSAVALFSEGSSETSVISTENLSAVIIGSGSPAYNPERASPSVLISWKNVKILIDMGNGTQANLDKIGVKSRELDGLFITHHHLDHNEELIPMFINCLLSGTKFVVSGPEGTKNYIEAINILYEKDIEYRMSKKKTRGENNQLKYEINDLSHGDKFSLKGISITIAEVNHTITTNAYRFDVDGKSIVISGDLTYSKSLPVLAENADILIIDSGGLIKKGQGSNRNNGHDSSRKNQAHASLDDVGRMAAEANVKTLVLTHIGNVEIDKDASIAVIAECFKGEIIFAEDLLELIP